MKQLLVLSGKGGTGKTTVASAFIKLSNAKAYADCDVDAPNLHLITKQKNKPKKTDYYGMPKAEIDLKLCIKCDKCRQNCRFDAINVNNIYNINPLSCEGCGVCEAICPVGAISLKPFVSGEIMLYSNEEKIFSTAQLKMGSGNSGMLVTEVKKKMMTEGEKAKLAIIDGSPGIGCPVIASISGVDIVLIVVEPSVSGISDMKRIIKTAMNFGVKIAVCINKYNINTKNSQNIKEFCKKEKISFVGEIPFDLDAVKAINDGKTIVDIDCPSGRAVKEIYDKMLKLIV